jgi:uncharacterized protein (DUF697 family)/tellurite resistance protein
MTITEQQKAILAVCLMASAADNYEDDRERSAVHRVAEALGGADLAALDDEIKRTRPDLATIVAALATPEDRQQAYDAAVGIVNADGAASARERDFLARLSQALGLNASSSQALAQQASAVASVPPSSNALDGALVSAIPASGADVDSMILNYSILNGALELLPQTLASMAIIPLQMRMVYRIGKAHGFELDQGHIKDLLATLGVGLTSQYLEQFGRKLVGGLLGKVGGGLLGGLGSASTGAAFSFATTYALGQVAKRYYAGGRTIDTAALQQSFSETLGRAKQLQGNYTAQIAEQARTLDLSKVMSAIRA